jgi:AraC-like DNA-binding protein
MPESRQPRNVARDVARHLAAGERIDTHHHDQAQLVYPAQGLLAVTTDRGTWMAPPQRAVWVPAGAGHSHHSYGTTDMRAVLFDPAMTGNARPRPTVVAVSPLLRELVLTLTDHRPRTPAIRRRLEHVTLDQLTEAPEQPLQLPEPNDDRLRAVTTALHADPASSDTLAELGHSVGASSRTLSRLFRQELNMGFHQWRTQLRVHHALVLLAAGLNVTETAAESGWANSSAFIDAFTTAVGQTPGRYLSALRATSARTRSEQGYTIPDARQA